MSFDNKYPNRKDRRKPYRKAKAFDRSCRNHGACPYCENGRKHPDKRRAPADEEIQIREALTGPSPREMEEIHAEQQELYSDDLGYDYGWDFEEWEYPYEGD